MNKYDINKLIEEEAERYNIVSSIIDNKKSFKAGANFFIHQNRWRKVEEEMPEVRDESYQILIRIPNIKSSATAWNIRNQSDCDIIAKMGNSEWKPIE